MSLPRDIQKRILKRCSQGKPAVVVPRNGKPSRVFSLDSYLATIEAARRARPWTRRKSKKAADPLGAVSGRVLSSLRRVEMYE